MALMKLLHFIEQHFSAEERKTLLHCLNEDPLMWGFFNHNGLGDPFLEAADVKLSSFSPGNVASWLIQEKFSLPPGRLTSEDEEIPESVKHKADKLFETTIRTGIVPGDLLSAGLLAIALKEHHDENKSWRLHLGNKSGENQTVIINNNFHIWRTPFAILKYYQPNFYDSFYSELKQSSSVVKQYAISIIMHSLITNPVPDDSLINEIFDFTRGLDIDSQLECLKWLDISNRHQLSKKIAAALVQQKSHIDYFSKVFSEFQTVEINHPDCDSLDKAICTSLPEDLNRAAAFQYYCGKLQKAAELYRQASQVFDLFKVQSLAQSILSQKETNSGSDWITVINAAPNSLKAQVNFIQSLIRNQNISEAEMHIQSLPDTPVKEYFKSQISPNKDLSFEGSINSDSFTINDQTKQFYAKASYLINSDTNDVQFEVLKTHLTNDTHLNFHFLNKLVDRFMNNKTIISLVRDNFLKQKYYERAIELTAYLSHMEPNEISHKLSFAKLHSLAGNWQEAFDRHQSLVSLVANPQLDFYEHFAISALQIGQYDVAVSLCQKILEQDSEHPSALVLLGKVYLSKGDSKKAIQHLEQVIETIPNEKKPWLVLADVWSQTGHPDRAIEILDKASKKLPHEAGIFHALGIANLENNQLNDAVAYLKKSYSLNPDNLQTVHDLALAQHHLGFNDDAYALLHPFASQNESLPGISKLLGQIMVATDKTESALPFLLKACEQDSNDTEIIITTAQTLIDYYENTFQEENTSFIKRLEKVLTQALSNNDNNEIKLYLADIARFKNNYKEAFDTYLQLADHEPVAKSINDWRVHYGMGKSAVTLGNLEIGLAALQNAATQQPENLPVLHALAEAYQKNELTEKGNQIAEKALQLAPEKIENILWYVDYKILNRELEEAVACLKEASQLNPNNTKIKLELAETLIATGSVDKAEKIISNIIDHNQSTGDHLHQAAYLAVNLNHLDMAVLALEKSNKSYNNDNPMVLLDLAICYTMTDNLQRALETLNLDQTVLNANPAMVMAKADILIASGDYSGAHDILLNFNEYISENPDIFNSTSSLEHSPLLYSRDFSHIGFLYRIGQLARLNGDLNASQKYLKSTLAEDPENVILQNALFESFFVDLQFDECIKTASLPHPEKNSNISSFDLMDLICTKAEALLYCDKLEEAEDVAINYLSQPYSYPRVNALLSRLASKNSDLEKSDKFFAEAVAGYGENWEDHPSKAPQVLFRKSLICLSMAEAASMLQDFASASTYFKKAVEIATHQPLQQWRYAKNLINLAENQRIADALSITSHAPGTDKLSTHNRETTEAVIQELMPKLVEEDYRCMKARCVSAFTGIWPLSMNSESCLSDPQVAAACLLGIKNNHDLAIEIVAAFPNNIQVLRAYAIYALKHGLESGAKRIETAVRMEPANPVNHYLNAVLNKHKPDEAYTSINNALELWPEETEWHILAADLAAQIGDPDAASHHIAMALNAYPENAKLWALKAEIEMQNNELENAKQALEKSVSIESDQVSYWINLAEINRRMKNLPEAIDNIKTAKGIDPDNMEIAKQEIEFLYQFGDYASAESQAGKLVQQHPDQTGLIILLANSQSQQGKIDQAEQTLSDAIDTLPESVGLKLERIKLHGLNKDVESVLPDLVGLAQEYPENPDILITLTDWLIQTKQYKKAEETAQIVLRIMPEQPEIHLMLGRLHRKNGQLDQAVNNLSNAITYDPSLVEAYIELGKAYQDRKDLEAAISVYQQGVAANSRDPRPYYFAGMALKECKDYSNAEVMLKQAKKYAPADPNIIRQLGVITALNLINNLRETR